MRAVLVFCMTTLLVVGPRIALTQPPEAAVPLLIDAGRAARTASAQADRADVARQRVMRVAWPALDADRLSLDLFPDLHLEADRAATTARDPRAWLGRVEGDPLSTVTLVRVGDVLQGSVRHAGGLFSIEPLGDAGLHVVRQLDPAALGRELPPLVAPPGRLPAMADRAVMAGDDGSTVDVLVAYNAAARAAAGGTDQAIVARIMLGVAETNLAYANSGVIQRLRLVGTEFVGYEETGDLATDLQLLTGPADPALTIVHERRAATGADLVSLIVGNINGGACGVAWMMQSLTLDFASLAFSVTAYPCISPNYTFGHELAHNMGSAHAPEDFNFSPVFNYSYGFKDPAERFRTVMAYDCPGGCPRVLHFSNPAALYTGLPTGSAATRNAESLNQTRLTVANFRQARDPSSLLAAPASFSVSTSGTTGVFSWAAPTTGTAERYVLEAGSAPGVTNIAELPVVSGTSVVVPAIAPGRYFVRVRAYNVFGPGPASSDVLLTMTADGRCIAPVSAPVLAPPTVNGALVSLSWTPGPAGGPPESWLVGAGSSSGVTDIAVLNTGGPEPAFTTTAAAGRYFVRVAGQNPCGIGTPSNEVVVDVVPVLPGSPSGLQASVAPSGVVTLTWTPPASGETPLSYLIEAGSIFGLSDIAVLSTGGAQPGYAVAAVPGTYYVRVRAVNAVGAGAPSNEIVVTVLPAS
jgi:peptidyl-Asp metalloendopeptidase